jgi:hypothetical protein
MKVHSTTRRWAKIHQGDDRNFQRLADFSAVPWGGPNHNEHRERVWHAAYQGPFVRRSKPPLAIPDSRWYRGA